MKKKGTIILVIAVIVSFVIPIFTGKDNCVGAAKKEGDDEKHKAIVILLDNSTSMVTGEENGNDKSAYEECRWYYADYAVKAISSMLDDGDILELCSLDEHLCTYTGGNAQEKQELENSLNGMHYISRTSVESLEQINEVLSKYDDEYERYCIIITDGDFRTYENDEDIEGSRVDLDEEIKKYIFSYQDGNLLDKENVRFVGIAANQTYPTEKVLDKSNIYKFENNQYGIFEQITKVINDLYSRITVSHSEKQKYITKQENRSSIHFGNVPIENAIVLIQNVNEKSFEEFSPQSWFISAKTTVPSKGGADPIISNYASEAAQKVGTLQGMVLIYDKNDIKSVSGEYYVELGTAVSDNIEIYYTPDVHLMVAISQNSADSSEEVTEMPQLSSKWKSNEAICYTDVEGNVFSETPQFQKGRMTMKLQYQDSEGNPIKMSEFLLKTSEMTVTIGDEKFKLSAYDLDSDIVEITTNIDEDDEGGYIEISNAINQTYDQIPIGHVYTSNVDISVSWAEENEETGQLNLDLDGNSVIYFHIEKDGAPLSESDWEKMDVELINREGDFASVSERSECEFNNGIVAVPISLVNPDGNELNGQGEGVEHFEFSVSLPYEESGDLREAAGFTFSSGLSINAEVPCVRFIQDDSEQTVNIVDMICSGVEIPGKLVVSDTNGTIKEEFTEEEISEYISELEVSDPHIKCFYKDGKLILKTKNIFNLINLSDWEWPAVRPDHIEMSIFVKYSKYGAVAKPETKLSIEAESKGIRYILFVLASYVSRAILILYGAWLIFLSCRASDYPVHGKINLGKLQFQFNTPNGTNSMNWSFLKRLIFYMWPFGSLIKRKVCIRYDNWEEGVLPNRLDLCFTYDDDRGNKKWKLERIQKTLNQLNNSSCTLYIGYNEVTEKSAGLFSGEKEAVRSNGLYLIDKKGRYQPFQIEIGEEDE